MAYRCQYQIDRGVPCPDWTREDETYCDVHRQKIKVVESMWRTAMDIVVKTQEKK